MKVAIRRSLLPMAVSMQSRRNKMPPRIRVSDLHGIGIGILMVVLFNRNGRALNLTSYDYHAPFLTLDLLLRNPFPLRIGLRPPHHG